MRWFRWRRTQSSQSTPQPETPPPNQGTVITNSTELTALMAKFPEPERPDLRGVIFSGAKLKGADFRKARLEKASFYNTKLRKAQLQGTCLQDAIMIDADLREANLTKANLDGADLEGANLKGAHLAGTSIKGAVLWNVCFNVNTQLVDVIIDEETRLADVQWNDVPLSRTNWKQTHKPLQPLRLGEEMAVRHSWSHEEKLHGYREARRMYHNFSTALLNQGMTRIASHYRLSEKRMERKMLKKAGQYPRLIFSALLNIIAGNGERPARIVTWYLIIILLFSGIYFWLSDFVTFANQPPQVMCLTNRPHPQLDPCEAVILSVASFHGRGFLSQSNLVQENTTPSAASQKSTVQENSTPFSHLSDPYALAGIGEALIGLFLEIIFIATFNRRFIED